MTWISYIKNIFSLPFPEEINKFGYIRSGLILSIFVLFFLFAFRPFDLYKIEGSLNLFKVSSIYATLTFMGFACSEFLFTYVLKIKKEGKSFTFGKWLVYVFITLFIISLINFIYARLSYFGYILWEYFPYMLRSTFLVGLIPVSIVGFLVMRKYELNFKKIAKNIEPAIFQKNLDKKEVFLGEINSRKIIYIESMQNYVRIKYKSQEDAYSEEIKRATLASMELELSDTNIIRCHRSFLVNKSYIVNVEGNSQGLLLNLDGIAYEVPVSRKYVSKFINSTAIT